MAVVTILEKALVGKHGDLGCPHCGTWHVTPIDPSDGLPAEVVPGVVECQIPECGLSFKIGEDEASFANRRSGLSQSLREDDGET